MTLIGVLGAARAQGAEIEIPNLSDAKDHFDTWLMSDPDSDVSEDIMIKRALGLQER